MKIRKICFSLIELLIVIAIITILAGMLLPALKMAKKQAESIRCASNLKQLAQTGTMYSTDYNEYVIPIFQSASPGKSWPLNLELLGYSKSILKLREEAFAPPSASYDQFYAMMRTTANFEDSRKIDNMQFLYGKKTSPSRFPFLMDSIVTSTKKQTYYLYWAGTTNYDNTRFINMRHNKKANIAAMDGHVLSCTGRAAQQSFSFENANDSMFITGTGSSLDIFNLYIE